MFSSVRPSDAADEAPRIGLVWAEAHGGVIGSGGGMPWHVPEDQTRTALGVWVDDVHINWVWMPPWGPDKITDDGREQLRALGFNV